MATRNSVRAIRLGAVYATAVFLAGFVLGTVRLLVIAPRTGDLAAVLLELPIILGISWLVFGGLARRQAPLPVAGRGLAGLAAFLTLIVLELILAAFIVPGGPAAMMAGWFTLTGGIGLAGQIAFALIPVWHPAARN
ncbi:hypothetical protein [Hyphobacterium sp.]|jgi:hypothetical protein|uniref:hypothetical protein n=1 Tax=Hyphobacterium sp. TaxID=2004662 RepID=UPI003BA8E62B